MSDAVDWQYRADYIWERHGIRVEEANEALAELRRLELNPDPGSRSGVSTRTIGYSLTRKQILTVITVSGEDKIFGSNAWVSDDRDIRKYWRAQGERKRT